MKRMFIGIALALSTLTLGATVPEKIANAPLVDQNGKPFQVHDLKGSFVFLSFIFTKCPMQTMCPLTMTKVGQVMRHWNDSGIKTPLKALVVTLDPETDTPSVLKKYGEAHKLNLAKAILATGAPSAITTFTESFNVMAFPSGGTLSHNLKSLLISPDLVEVAQYKDNEFTADAVIKDAKASAFMGK